MDEEDDERHKAYVNAPLFESVADVEDDPLKKVSNVQFAADVAGFSNNKKRKNAEKLHPPFHMGRITVKEKKNRWKFLV